ncbi:unnamed protein product [Trichogramma brassicae]|uniref:LRRCT domain-containing protein n=1 Tax=Trichogramma brassicae TaxID=86971 RepID=A0A6H5IYT8_9HYME|nr:unnamed protein product [Trichogramma brassicae]
MPDTRPGKWRLSLLLLLAAAFVLAEAKSTTVLNNSTRHDNDNNEAAVTTTHRASTSVVVVADTDIDEEDDKQLLPKSSTSHPPPPPPPPIVASWECPEITGQGIECSCDFPHTLRCIGDRTSLKSIGAHLRGLRPGRISLLDATLQGIASLPADFLEGVALHGLVVSSGELRRLNENAFSALAQPLQALGLPNNQLDQVPIHALGKIALGLERLDLSHNKFKILEAGSFKNLNNVTYLDLSGNLLTQLSPEVFASLPQLRMLKMRGNRLSVSALKAFRGLRSLEELDLSANMLMGPLGPGLIPSAMPTAQSQPGRESIEERGQRHANGTEEFVLARLEPQSGERERDKKKKQINFGASRLIRKRCHMLMILKLVFLYSHIQIDVLEDHAFRQLTNLRHLDLSYNDIVAVSSLSLAHLDRLRSLDLTHNFLRSLNGDLLAPRNLERLRLDDNDITMVTPDVSAKTSKLLMLKSLSLADNPLNCDCNLAEFARWFAASGLEPEDKRSAVCATPPALENGPLTQVAPDNLLCGEDPSSASSSSSSSSSASVAGMTRLPLAAAQLTLKEFHYDEATAGGDMLWRVEPCTERYTCDTLIVYEAQRDGREVQLASSPIECDSRHMPHPCALSLGVPASIRLQPGHRYRYCVVLMVPPPAHQGKDDRHRRRDGDDDDVSLGLGCSDIIELEDTLDLLDMERKKLPAMTPPPLLQPDIKDLRVNVSDEGYLKVAVALLETPRVGCEIDLDILAIETGQVHRQRLNCSAQANELAGLVPGRYKICASVETESASRRPREGHARCVEVQTLRQQYPSQATVAVVLCGLLVLALVTACCIGRSLARTRKKAAQIGGGCAPAAGQQLEITHKAHYIKLQATTKV